MKIFTDRNTGRSPGRLLTGLVTALALAAPLPAAADDSNYQTYIIGARASGMGGAHTALADTAGGEYYNPAALSQVDRSSVSLSHSFYSYQRRQLTDAVGLGQDQPGDRTDLTGHTFPTIPAAVSFAAQVARDKAFFRRISFGYSMFVPYYSRFSFDGTAEAGTPDTRLYRIRIDLMSNDKTLMHGPTVAALFARGWGVGLSIFHLYRTAETWTAGHALTPPPNDDGLTDFLTRTEARLKRNVHSMVFKLGARYEIDDNFTVGLAVTSPSITLAGSGDVRSGTISTNVGDGCTTTPCVLYREAFIEPDVDSKRPFAVRLGGAFVSDREDLTLALDINIHGPVTYNPFGVADPREVIPEYNIRQIPAGYAVVGQIKRRALANVNIGAEYRVRSWEFRGGFFTNFSSAPAVLPSSFAQLSDVDMFGVSVAVGYSWTRSSLSLGVLYSFGNGSISAVSPPPPGSPNLIFGPYPERRDYVFFYIQGAAKALGRTANKVKQHITGTSK